ncbi:unnamed protein product, partial [Polarella glacialis]
MADEHRSSGIDEDDEVTLFGLDSSVASDGPANTAAGAATADAGTAAPAGSTSAPGGGDAGVGTGASTSSASKGVGPLASWASKFGRKASQLTEAARGAVAQEAKNVAEDVRDWKAGVIEGVRLTAQDGKALKERLGREAPQGLKGLGSLFRPPPRGESEASAAEPTGSEATSSSPGLEATSASLGVEATSASSSADSAVGAPTGFKATIRDLQAGRQP